MPRKEPEMAAIKTDFSQIARNFVAKGDSRDLNGGDHPLMSVKESFVENSLSVAQKLGGDGAVWALIAVLLRLRFGDFVFRPRQTSELLRLEEQAVDDVEFSVKALRCLLKGYGANLKSLRSLFEGKRSLKGTVFSTITNLGFKDQVAISMLAFLRDNNWCLPSSLGKVPGGDIEMRVLLPFMWEVFGVGNGAFVTGDHLVTKIVNGKVSGRDYLVDENSCLKTSIRGIVIGDLGHAQNGENILTFGMMAGTDLSPSVLRMTSEPNFPDLLFGQEETVVAKAESAGAVGIDTKPKTEPRKPESPEELVKTALAAVNALQGRLKNETALLEASRKKLAANLQREEEEILRHQTEMEQVCGERQDLESDVARLNTQVEELRASLLALGINPTI